MKALKSLFLSAALVLGTVATSFASVPWLTGTNAINVQAPSAGAATCTSFSTSDVCYLNLTGSLTSLTLSGGTAGKNYLLIFAQDATGGRLLTAPTNLIASADLGTLPAIPTTANAWTVWSVQKVGTNYVVTATADNLNLAATQLGLVFANGSQASAGLCDFAISQVCSVSWTGNGTLTLKHLAQAAGLNDAIIVTQDATGGRTTTFSIVGGGAINLPNGGTVGTNLFNTTASATASLQLIGDGTNLNVGALAGDAIGGGPYTVTTAGTQVNAGTTQAQTGVTITGMTTTSICQCQPQTLPATWQTGVQLMCVPTSNTATCQIINPTAGNITPAAITLNVLAFF